MKAAGTYRITVVDGETTREELVLADDFTIAPSFFGGYGSLTLTLDGANVAYFPNGCWKGEVVRVEQPAAKAALDALIAEEQEEWVELNGYWRISTDGIKVQRRDWCEDGDPWVDTTEAPELVKLYRTGLAHGLSVAQAEHEALREQVRALMEAIGKPYSVRFTADVREKPGSAECAYYQIEPTGMVRVDGVRELVEWVESVQEAAKAVQL